jgi:hypothetical protein
MFAPDAVFYERDPNAMALVIAVQIDEWWTLDDLYSTPTGSEK